MKKENYCALTREEWVKDLVQHTREIRKLEKKLTQKNRPYDIIEDLMILKMEKADLFINGYLQHVEKANEREI